MLKLRWADVCDGNDSNIVYPREIVLRMFIMIRTNATTAAIFTAIFQAKQNADASESCCHEIVNQQGWNLAEGSGGAAEELWKSSRI